MRRKRISKRRWKARIRLGRPIYHIDAENYKLFPLPWYYRYSIYQDSWIVV